MSYLQVFCALFTMDRDLFHNPIFIIPFFTQQAFLKLTLVSRMGCPTTLGPPQATRQLFDSQTFSEIRTQHSKLFWQPNLGQNLNSTQQAFWQPNHGRNLNSTQQAFLTARPWAKFELNAASFLTAKPWAKFELNTASFFDIQTLDKIRTQHCK